MQARCALLDVDHRHVDAHGWAELAQAAHERGARLLTLWGRDGVPGQANGTTLYACWLDAGGLLLAQIDLAPGVTHDPGLHAAFPVAERLQRALRDLLGVQALGESKINGKNRKKNAAGDGLAGNVQQDQPGPHSGHSAL